VKKLYIVSIALGIVLIISANLSCNNAIKNITEINIGLMVSGIYESPLQQSKTINTINLIKKIREVCYVLGFVLITMNSLLIFKDWKERRKQIE